MVGFIFGIIVLLAGIITGICLAKHETEEVVSDGWYSKSTGKMIKPYAKYAKIPYSVGTTLGFVLIALGCIVSVGTGKTGVVTTFGKLESYTYQSGFHFKAPWNKVTKIDTTINEINISTPAYTNDSQTVDLAMTVQYRISPTDTFSVVGDNGLWNTQKTLESKLQNRIVTVAKNIVATKKAEDLLTNRSALVAELASEIDVFNDEYYVIISAVNLINIDFTDEYEAAVAAKVAQKQAYEKALIEQEQALAQAENEKKIAETKANADAEVAKIQAAADLAVQQINADASEYTGRKESAVVLNRLAGINGWSVKLDEQTGIYKLLNVDGTEVTETQRVVGVEKLIEYYYTQTWNGTLPETYVGDDSVSTILIGGTK